MKIAVLAFTQAGYDLGIRFAEQTSATVDRCPAGGLASWTADHFTNCNALVFIGSVGIAVRAVAPHVVSKTSDPAVIVIDEPGNFVIPILSGHIGQANTLARKLATFIKATPVLTTATDARHLFAVDDWATRQGLWIINSDRIKSVSSRLLAGSPIRIASDFPIDGPLPSGVVHVNESLPPGVPHSDDRWDVIITCRNVDKDDTALHLMPRAITVGIGCRRGTTADAIEAAVKEALAIAGYHPRSVTGVASIKLKADELGLLAYCAHRRLTFHTFSADRLNRVDGNFTASEFVTNITGVDNVCERAAVADSGGKLVAPKAVFGGVAVALALREPSLRFDEPKTEELKGR